MKVNQGKRNNWGRRKEPEDTSRGSGRGGKEDRGIGHEGEFGSKARSVATGHKGGSFQETCMRKMKQKECRRKMQTDLMVAIQKPANCLHGCL